MPDRMPEWIKKTSGIEPDLHRLETDNDDDVAYTSADGERRKRMPTEQQLKEASRVDISYFRAYYSACPHCGINFDEMHPLMNLYPHFTGECEEKQDARQTNNHGN